MATMELDVPESLEPYVSEIRFIMQMMFIKLHVNRHKGFINNMYNGRPVSSLIDRIHDEYMETRDAMENDNQFKVAEECADVANMALLTAIQVLRLTRKEFDDEQATVKTPTVSIGSGTVAGSTYAEEPISSRAQLPGDPDWG